MTFAPFYEYFPVLASEETLQINITSQAPGDPPSGEYYFHELFCFDPECDCQNAIIAVNRKNKEGKFEEVTRLRFCWKNNTFYEEIGLLFGNDILPGVFPDMNRRPARFDDYFAKLFESKCYERSHNSFKPQETPYTKKVKHHYKLYKEHLIRKSPNKQLQDK
ncbi:MAG: hypothetical protein H0W50_04410 [Parachlamydiaceae bacterium]|nr:hypothetical protein [Parachlamydiaceae bacterium]